MKAHVAALIGVLGLASTAAAQDAALGELGTRCGQGDGPACRAIAARYIPGDPSAETVHRVLRQACDDAAYVGHTEGAARFRAAQRRAQPCEVALSGLLRQACDAGRDWDCLELASQLEYAFGALRDLPGARRILDRVCQGSTDRAAAGSACSQLGEHYEEGRGIRRDPARALSLYERGCELLPSSCQRLGWLQQTGALGPADREAARRSYQRACDAGIPSSCNSLRALDE